MGIYTGATLHEVAHVVGAGDAMGNGIDGSKQCDSTVHLQQLTKIDAATNSHSHNNHIDQHYANSLRNHLPETWVPGIQFCSKKILRIGIILYGFRLTFQDVMAIGLPGWFRRLLA